ncbi:hypothetical protein [Arthrobacter sp. AQ5-05]|uniref:hypothetical protein n=1 Tax=Arthrobacter sp. AQ5-05 TaxID=2184581 RepID=UPI0012B51CE6|nr:hypothetical protein [Arthrobacter sp. AQ5-05]
MDRKYLARVGAAFLVVGAMTGCTAGSQSGSFEVEVRAMAPGAQGGSYEVKVIGPDGDFVNSQEVVVGSTYGIEGIHFGWVSVETTSGCTAKRELTSESPTLRMVIDGENCILSD